MSSAWLGNIEGKKRSKECGAPDIPTENMGRVVEFVLKNFLFFYFNENFKGQKLGRAIGAKFTPPSAFIFMNEVEREFLKSQEVQPFS